MHVRPQRRIDLLSDGLAESKGAETGCRQKQGSDPRSQPPNRPERFSATRAAAKQGCHWIGYLFCSCHFSRRAHRERHPQTTNGRARRQRATLRGEDTAPYQLARPHACPELEVRLPMNRPLTPSLSPSDGERVAGGRVRGWFMVPMRVKSSGSSLQEGAWGTGR